MPYSSNTYTFLFIHQMNINKQITAKWLSQYVEKTTSNSSNYELGCIYDYDSDSDDEKETDIQNRHALEILIEILGDDDDNIT